MLKSNTIYYEDISPPIYLRLKSVEHYRGTVLVELSFFPSFIASIVARRKVKDLDEALQYGNIKEVKEI